MNGVKPTRRDPLLFVAVVAALAAAGAVAGLVWNVVAPRIHAEMTDAGVVPTNAETSAFIGADMAFLVVVAAAGILAGVAGWLLARAHGVTVALAQAGGGLLAAYIASIVGHAAGAGGVDHWVRTAAAGSQHAWYLDLRATAIIFVWPFAAVFVHLLLTMVFVPPEPTGGAGRPPAVHAADPAV